MHPTSLTFKTIAHPIQIKIYFYFYSRSIYFDDFGHLCLMMPNGYYEKLLTECMNISLERYIAIKLKLKLKLKLFDCTSPV